MVLGDLFIALVEQELAGFGFGLASPREAAQRGSQVSLTHEQGYAIMQALIARGVIGDFRAPDILRFGFAALYVRHVDVWDAVAVLREVMRTRDWDRPEFLARKAVT
jgi:kynureninase